MKKVLVLSLAITASSCAHGPKFDTHDIKGDIYSVYSYSWIGKLNDESSFKKLQGQAEEFCTGKKKSFEFVSKSSNGITGQELWFRCI